MKTSTPDVPKVLSPLKILLMGPPGSRKTTFILQFPGVHVLDCDQNLDGPETFLRKAGVKLSYTYDPIRTDDSGKPIEVDECYNRVIDILSRFKTLPEYKARKLVFLDSLSHVNEFIIRNVLKLQGKTRKTYEMEARDWSPFKSFGYNLLVGKLDETNKTVVCTAHEIKIYGKPEKDNMMNPPVEGIEPFFQGKLGETIGAFFTDVWRLEVRPAPGGRSETILQTSATPKVSILKNSLCMPPEVDVTSGYFAVEPFLKGRI